MNNDLLNDVLNELHNNTPTLQAAGVMSVDGLTLAACFPSFMDEDRFGNLSAGKDKKSVYLVLPVCGASAAMLNPHSPTMTNALHWLLPLMLF